MGGPASSGNVIYTNCTGTSLRDFVRASDYQRMPEEVVAPYDTAIRPKDAVLVYEPQLVGSK
jgi:hypothetical protein